MGVKKMAKACAKGNQNNIINSYYFSYYYYFIFIETAK